MAVPLASQAAQAAFPHIPLRPDSSRKYSIYNTPTRSIVPVSHGFVTPFPYVAGTSATLGTLPFMQQVVPQFTHHQPHNMYPQNTYYQHLQASLPETFSPLVPVLNNICDNTNHQLQKIMTMKNKIPGVPTTIKEASLDTYGDSPYVDPIDAIDIPKRFSPPIILVYDGTTDPREHILTYKQRMMTIPVPKHMREASLFKGFGSTLIGPARKWFTSWPNGCITSFAHLGNMFNQQFASSRGLEKQTSDLYRVVQRPNEPLKDYIA
ncbi:uncharacterized protein [Spinacia oleracea]|uniref:Retrotransposon gag domain-containing protein n=1 Tax=Spinacia oleracea TaxID=3562 RepID=A0ABM3R882_SPIOL|nr:uncharacterized protein LOC130467366 [Spinacia oleracea]